MALEDNTKSGGKGKGLSKKVGPLDIWQYIAIGTGLGVILYVYKKNHASKGEGNAELEKAQKEKELAEEEASNLRFNGPSSAGGGNTGAGGGGTSQTGPTAAEIAALVQPGPAGAPGAAGPPGESAQSFNTPPTGEASVAPIATRQTHAPTNPLIGKNAKGEQYTLKFNSKGQPEHVYKGGRTVVLVGNAAKEGIKILDKAGKGGKRAKAGDTAKINHSKAKPLKVPHKTPAKKAPAKHPAKKKKTRG
jgi:hypothetical protein